MKHQTSDSLSDLLASMCLFAIFGAFGAYVVFEELLPLVAAAVLGSLVGLGLAFEKHPSPPDPVERGQEHEATSVTG